jgi:hypothetical protein
MAVFEYIPDHPAKICPVCKLPFRSGGECCYTCSKDRMIVKINKAVNKYKQEGKKE